MTAYESIIRPILDSAVALGATDVIIFAPEPASAPGDTLSGSYAAVRGHVRPMTDAPAVTSDDVELFLREIGLELGGDFQAEADGSLGETICFNARRSGNRSIDISFRHLQGVPRSADTGNGGHTAWKNPEATGV